MKKFEMFPVEKQMQDYYFLSFLTLWWAQIEYPAAPYVFSV